MEFLETWKCQGILHRSGKRHKVRERSANLCSHGIWLWQVDNLLVTVMCTDTCWEHHVTYLYFIRSLNAFCITDVQHFLSWLKSVAEMCNLLISNNVNGSLAEEAQISMMWRRGVLVTDDVVFAVHWMPRRLHCCVTVYARIVRADQLCRSELSVCPWPFLSVNS